MHAVNRLIIGITRFSVGMGPVENPENIHIIGNEKDVVHSRGYRFPK